MGKRKQLGCIVKGMESVMKFTELKKVHDFCMKILNDIDSKATDAIVACILMTILITICHADEPEIFVITGVLMLVIF